MAQHDLDYYVSFDPVNVYYLTNFGHYVHERPFLLVISRQGQPTMLVPYLEIAHVKERARCELQFVTYYEFPAPQGQNWFDVYATMFSPESGHRRFRTIRTAFPSSLSRWNTVALT
jgi:Xaa-Pro dipeptidase